MGETNPHQVTQLLKDARAGRREAVDELFDVVYGELHAVAVRRMRSEDAGNLLQPTALVNETYLRLFGDNPAPLYGRQHFFSVAASAMRRILIDMARLENAAKRGGKQNQVELEDWMHISDASPELQIDLQRALEKLSSMDPRAAEIMDFVTFGGRSTEEVAELLQIARRTVERDLASARLFVKRFLSSDGTHA